MKLEHKFTFTKCKSVNSKYTILSSIRNQSEIFVSNGVFFFFNIHSEILKIPSTSGVKVKSDPK